MTYEGKQKKTVERTSSHMTSENLGFSQLTEVVVFGQSIQVRSKFGH